MMQVHDFLNVCLLTNKSIRFSIPSTRSLRNQIPTTPISHIQTNHVVKARIFYKKPSLVGVFFYFKKEGTNGATCLVGPDFSVGRLGHMLAQFTRHTSVFFFFSFFLKFEFSLASSPRQDSPTFQHLGEQDSGGYLPLPKD